MSYGLMPYSVRVEILREPHGYAPVHALAEAQQRHGGSDPSRYQAMRELFFNEPFTSTEGYLYGYALKGLCEALGDPMPNRHWMPFSMSGHHLVTDALAGVGVQFDAYRLTTSLSPVDLPPIEEFPSIGHVLRADMEPVDAQFAAADLSAIADQSIRGAAEELRGWIRYCLQDNADLVCFYH